MNGPGYSLAEVAAFLKVSPERIQGLLDAGLVAAPVAQDGERRFTFQDIALLGSAHRMAEGRTAPADIVASIAKLRDRQGPRPSTARWDPTTGQGAFDFGAHPPADLSSAEMWFARGCELEAAQPARAQEAYRRALVHHPGHADAHINLGRLLHESRDAAGAREHYAAALEARPADATAEFNLGTALEDLGQVPQAIAAYARAIALEPGCADAYFNLARLYERAGRRADAFRHLRTYKELAQR